MVDGPVPHAIERRSARPSFPQPVTTSKPEGSQTSAKAAAPRVESTPQSTPGAASISPVGSARADTPKSGTTARPYDANADSPEINPPPTRGGPGPDGSI
jgi:hypothetical protein